ncbi:unnamed protein product [Nippostrongylus brasiliensis]|uniref:Transcription factor interactor and regulator CCHC(Zn) family n=1 Tax=Nippostrongylus brasiliensis TaxID=27835 RepID=A0A0N4YBH3_NIPBR|nr:unnamed protein product [Nippostrongylus brasiliensis]
MSSIATKKPMVVVDRRQLQRCSFCDSNQHSSFRCDQFGAPQLRIKVVKGRRHSSLQPAQITMPSNVEQPAELTAYTNNTEGTPTASILSMFTEITAEVSTWNEGKFTYNQELECSASPIRGIISYSL